MGRSHRRTHSVGLGAVPLALLGLVGCPRPLPAPPPPLPPTPAAPAEPPPAPAPVAEDPVLPPATAERLVRAVAWLLEGEGPLVRLRLFVPAPASSTAPEFDAELRAAAAAVRAATPRLARVDVTVGPYDEAAVTALRGLGILPRTGGEPDTVRALVVGVGDRLTPIADLSPSRGAPGTQLLLALHRVVRGPIRVGVILPQGDTASGEALLAALADFALLPVDDSTDPAGLTAVVVLASGTGPLPPWTAGVVDRVLSAGGGVVVLGGRRAMLDRRGSLEAVPSPSDPSRLVARSGVSLEDGVVVDPSCARVSVPSGPGRLFLSYPPFVRTQVTLPDGGGTTLGVLPFASPLRVEEREGVEVLARSSPDSWIEDGAAGWDPSRDWRPGARVGSWPLAVAVRVPPGEGGRDAGRLVVVSTAKLAERDGLALEANAGLLAALVAWTADVEELLLVGGSEEEQTP